LFTRNFVKIPGWWDFFPDFDKQPSNRSRSGPLGLVPPRNWCKSMSPSKALHLHSSEAVLVLQGGRVGQGGGGGQVSENSSLKLNSYPPVDRLRFFSVCEKKWLVSEPTILEIYPETETSSSHLKIHAWKMNENEISF